MSDSSRPHGLQPTRLLHPWDFPGKSTGVGIGHIQSGEDLNRTERLTLPQVKRNSLAQQIFELEH